MPNWPIPDRRMPEHRVDKPATDHDGFVYMCLVILVSRPNWRTLDKIG
jgi:hypothetical protein